MCDKLMQFTGISNVRINFSTHLFVEWIQECNSLDGLAETHLVGQDGADVVSPRIPKPVQTLQLVVMQLASADIDVVGLFLQFLPQLWFFFFFEKERKWISGTTRIFFYVSGVLKKSMHSTQASMYAQ